MTEKEQKIFPISLVIESMKDSGYKDAAHAVAELIDNSIQAGESLEQTVDVELICLEEMNQLKDRQSSQIYKIAVYDNAEGMSPEVLHKALAFGEGTRRGAKTGIGKFGMGLPNASISQCNRVDVWSWQNGECYHSYLDLKEISNTGNETIPHPKKSSIPEEWKTKVHSNISDSGTLIVWSDLDRLKWKRHKAFFSNTEFTVGRMYRYFIQDNKCQIRMAAYNGQEKVFDEYIKPNDPLYLLPNTNTPEPFNDEPGFKLYAEESITVEFRGESHKIDLKFSIADNKFRKNFNDYYKDKNYGNPGDTPFGKHCAKNLGISIVRAGRELELNNSFNIQYDPTERWWGAEISFDATLDEIFGVTNNKQAATAFKQLTKEEIANEEDIKPSEVKKHLQAENDSRHIILDISEQIYSKLQAIRGELKKQREGAAKKDETAKTDQAEKAASDAAKSVEGLGVSDKKKEALTEEEKKQELQKELERDGVSPDDEDIQTVINIALENDEKFIIGVSDMRGADIIFDVTQPAGKLKVTINESHVFYKNLIEPLMGINDRSLDFIKLLFASWALMEDREQDENLRDQLLEIRKEWGQYAKKMINEYLKN